MGAEPILGISSLPETRGNDNRNVGVDLARMRLFVCRELPCAAAASVQAQTLLAGDSLSAGYRCRPNRAGLPCLYRKVAAAGGRTHPTNASISGERPRAAWPGLAALFETHKRRDWR